MRTQVAHRVQEVVGAGDEEPLRHVVAPAPEGAGGDADGVGPDEEDAQERHARRDLLPRQSLQVDILRLNFPSTWKMRLP